MTENNYVFVATINNKKYQEVPFLAHDQIGIQKFIDNNKDKDMYLTPNLFKSPSSHLRNNIDTMRVIFIDLDPIEKNDGITLNDAIIFIEELKDHFNRDIPTPSHINYSGRGIHLYFSIYPIPYEDVHHKIIYRLAEVIDKTIKNATDYGVKNLRVDMGAIGAERIIRVVNSTNHKTDRKVETIYQSNTTYDIDDIVDNFLPQVDKLLVKQTEPALSTNMQKSVPKNDSILAQQKLIKWLNAALSDLKVIQSIRNLNEDHHLQKTNQGHRNNMIFFYGLLYKSLTKDNNETYLHMVEFNSQFRQPLNIKEVQSIFHGLNRRKCYSPSNKKMLTVLSITIDEQTSLATIIDRQEITKRKMDKQKRSRKEKSELIASSRTVLVNEVKKLYESGTNVNKIAQVLHLSRPTIYKYLSKV